jgi:hypothetical protein
MIEYAGLGVWVDNRSELRDRADFIVASNNNHGVAEGTQIYFELKLFTSYVLVSIIKLRSNYSCIMPELLD